MDRIWIVAAGGALGSVLRDFIASSWNKTLAGSSFPYGTLAVNLIGSLLIGLLMGIFSDAFIVAPGWRRFLITGLLGGFTTFSAFSYELFQLIEKGQNLMALAYFCFSAFGGLAAVAGGFWLATRLI